MPSGRSGRLYYIFFPIFTQARIRDSVNFDTIAHRGDSMSAVKTAVVAHWPRNPASRRPPYTVYSTLPERRLPLIPLRFSAMALALPWENFSALQSLIIWIRRSDRKPLRALYSVFLSYHIVIISTIFIFLFSAYNEPVLLSGGGESHRRLQSVMGDDAEKGHLPI